MVSYVLLLKFIYTACKRKEGTKSAKKPNQLHKKMSDSSQSEDNEMVSYGWT
jgi:hypothetical protein